MQTITVNMGNGKYMTLPQANSNINVTINDNLEELSLIVRATNTLTQESRETRLNLNDFPVIFGNYESHNILRNGVTSASEGTNPLLKTIDLVNNSAGGMGSGMGRLDGSFRLSNGKANGSNFSPKYYESNWKGGSRAKITTYNATKWGGRIAKGTLVISIGLGIL